MGAKLLVDQGMAMFIKYPELETWCLVAVPSGFKLFGCCSSNSFVSSINLSFWHLTYQECHNFDSLSLGSIEPHYQVMSK